MKNEADQRWRAVELGIAVEHLIASPPVQQMIVDAETERTTLCEDLARLDLDEPTGLATFKRKQARIHVLDTWQQFFADYIKRGQAAADALEIEDTPLGGDRPEPPENSDAS